MEPITPNAGKTKLKKQVQFVTDIILVLIAALFILIAFIYALDKSNTIGDSLSNVRYGLFSFALLISGTALIIAVYLKFKGRNRKPFYLRKRNETDKKLKKKKLVI